MAVDSLASAGGSVQDTNARTMMATWMMMPTVMASVMVMVVMVLVLTVNSSSTVAVSAGTRAGIGSPLAAAVGVIE